MVSVVVHHGNSPLLADLLETSDGAVEIVQTAPYVIPAKPSASCRSSCRQRIEHVVLSGNVDPESSGVLARLVDIELGGHARGASYLGEVVVVSALAEGDDLLVKTLDSLHGVGVAAVYYKLAGGLLRKGAEALDDVLKRAEVVEVVGVNVEYHCRVGREFQEVILKLAGLADKYVAGAEPSRPADCRQLAADKAAFDEYKTAQKAEAERLLQEGDSDACATLVETAVAAIDDLAYNEGANLAANKSVIDAIIAQLTDDLAAQRASEGAASYQSRPCPICGKTHSAGGVDNMLGEFHWYTYMFKYIFYSFLSIMGYDAPYAALKA